MKNKIKYILLIILFTVGLLTNLLWLSCIIVLIYLFNSVIHYFLSKLENLIIKKISKAIFSFFIILSIAILTRILVIDVYSVPSQSMESTLYKGDYILVNKLKYGPLLPRSPYEIPWVNIFYFLHDNSKEAVQSKIWKNRRLSGYSNVENGDVLVFKRDETSALLVKRCIAVAGNKVEIKDGEIYINDKHQKPNPNIKNFYYFKISDLHQFTKKKEELQLNFTLKRKKQKNWYRAHLSYNEVSLLKKLKCVDTIHKKREVYNLKDNLFPNLNTQQWTISDYGPLKIPKKGMLLNLKNKNEFALYKQTLKLHEHDKNELVLKNPPTEKYQFLHDYYFMMGDNRKQSTDSRFFGFIPKNKVVSQVSCVLFSFKDNEFQWERVFKNI